MTKIDEIMQHEEMMMMNMKRDNINNNNNVSESGYVNEFGTTIIVNKK